MISGGSRGLDTKARTKRASLVALCATVTLSGMWVIFSRYVAPSLIARAYHGESLAFLNRLITGQASHPLAEYLSDWQRTSWHLLFGLVLAGLLSLIVIQPGVQTLLWGRAAFSPRSSSGISPVAPQRIMLLNMMMALIIGGSLYNIAMDTEHWPFSNYPMYSFEEKSWTLTKFRLYGVTQEDPLHEFPLIQFQYTQPFDNSRVNYAFASMEGSRHRDLDFRDAVHNCFRRYEEHRREGRNNGPPLQAMRLYRVYWVLDPWARNADRPDRKDLIVEVTRAELGQH